MRISAAAVVLAWAGCGKHAEDQAPRADDARATAIAADARTATAPPIDAAAAPTPATWPELADLPPGAPWRIVELPIADAAAPAASSGGPVIIDQVAVVATSRAGFVAVDLTTAEVMWSRRSGPRVAPPVSDGDRAILVGDCLPGPLPTLAAGDVALGCFDVVDPVHITDERAGIIHGAKATVGAFDRASGPVLTQLTGDGALLWRRGDRAIRVDLTTGAATPAKLGEVADHVDLAYGGGRWTYTLEGDTLTGAADGVARWTSPTSGAVLIGAFNDKPPRVPLVRLAGRGRARPDPHDGARPSTTPPARRHGPGTAHDPQRPSRLLLLDVAGTDGMLGQVSHSFPGVAAESSAFGTGGATIVAVRLDDSALRHYIAAFDGNGMPLWAWPLPEPMDGAPRAAPVRVALAPDGWVVALFDDRLAILPLVSQPPTPDLPPSRNSTP